MECPDCHRLNPDDSKFCNECGCNFAGTLYAADAIPALEGERKHVTIMFSDMSGYTAMNERLDPEEVKGIMSRIFGEITGIIKNYDGAIEKFIGDAVMAVFGVPEAHEDDPIRAIKAAMEIHTAVDNLSPEFETKIGRPLTMHTGINTGLVVTGEIDVEAGTQELTGDAINLASRLEGIANAHEIIVGPDTFNQALNHFEFEALKPTKIKGKQQPVHIYKVQSAKKESLKTHRLQGLQATLTGREQEMLLLNEAVKRLINGQGSVISISGDAGTGKSRLKKEFKDALSPDEIQWIEGHAYGYTQCMPYYPLIDLLIKTFQIEESDPPEEIRSKFNAGAAYLLGEDSRYIPYIGSLLALDYPEIESVSPEYWKEQLGESIQAILTSLADKGPTVVCIEDLHWADPSFIEFFKHIAVGSHLEVLIICTYRSHFKLYDSDLPKDFKDHYQEIHLKDLAAMDAHGMLKSLLRTQIIPESLYDFVQRKTEGNPFYLEEVINSLIESRILTRDNGNWNLNGKITEADIPVTVYGVLSARIDRLDRPLKRILQEASVIGRAFHYRILRMTTDLGHNAGRCLSDLEDLDLIRTQSIEPELEYRFKHALIQEIVYNGLLKKERRDIHERIGLAIEQLFADRLPEHYDALAFHFKYGCSRFKAVYYLTKAGEKSLKRYALEESHQYFKEAFNYFTDNPGLSEKEKDQLIDILIKWAYVFYYRGDFKSLIELFRQNEQIAESLTDNKKQGYFLAWFGMALWLREKLRESERYLRRALKLGEASKSQRLTGYANCWLSLTCSSLGLFKEALDLANRAHQIARKLESDHYLFFKSLHAKGLAYYYMGLSTENIQIGKTLLDYGSKHSNIRCLVMGHFHTAISHAAAGNNSLAIESGLHAVNVSADPLYSVFPKSVIAFNYLQRGAFKKAETLGYEILSFSQKFGVEYHGTLASAIQGMVMIADGKMAKGFRQIEDVFKRLKELERNSLIPTFEYLLGKLYFQMSAGEGPVSILTILKNSVFLARTLPKAKKRAEYHLSKAADMAEEFGVKGVVGQAYLDLGLLYKSQKRKVQAEQYITKAIQVFEEIKADVYLKQAKHAIKSLG